MTIAKNRLSVGLARARAAYTGSTPPPATPLDTYRKYAAARAASTSVTAASAMAVAARDGTFEVSNPLQIAPLPLSGPARSVRMPSKVRPNDSAAAVISNQPKGGWRYAVVAAFCAVVSLAVATFSILMGGKLGLWMTCELSCCRNYSFSDVTHIQTLVLSSRRLYRGCIGLRHHRPRHRSARDHSRSRARCVFLQCQSCVHQTQAASRALVGSRGISWHGALGS